MNNWEEISGLDFTGTDTFVSRRTGNRVPNPDLVLCFINEYITDEKINSIRVYSLTSTEGYTSHQCLNDFIVLPEFIVYCTTFVKDKHRLHRFLINTTDMRACADFWLNQYRSHSLLSENTSLPRLIYENIGLQIPDLLLKVSKN